MTTTKMMNKVAISPIDELIAEHREWVRAYNEVSRAAQVNYPAPMTDAQKEAYRTLPDLIAKCEASYYAIPERYRTPHFLLS